VDLLRRVSIRAIARAVVVVRYDRLPKAPDATYSREDIQREMRETTFDAIQKYPSFTYPGITMLAGGLLLAFARRGSTPGSGAIRPTPC